MEKNKNLSNTDYFDFERVKKYISELNYEEKLSYLVTIKAEYMSMGLKEMERANPSFDALCDIEIQKNKELIEIADIAFKQDGLPRNLRQFNEKIDMRAQGWQTMDQISEKRIKEGRESEEDLPNKVLSTRQIVILLLTLMYGKPEVPEAIENKTELANFICSNQDSSAEVVGNLTSVR
jgi:hypothetical protein